MGSPVALAAIALACLGWAVDNNLTRKIALTDPVQIAALKGAVAGVVNVALALSAGASVPSAGKIGAAALVGLVGYGASLVLFVRALRAAGRHGPGRTSPSRRSSAELYRWRCSGRRCRSGSSRPAS